MPKPLAKRLSRKKIFSGYCFDVTVDQVLWPNGKRLSRDLIHHPGISVIVPEIDAQHIVLIEQYRYGAGTHLWEIPAGTIDGKESPLACAKREIQEEIGYKASQWKPITSFFASPGFNTELIHSFAASKLRKTENALEDDEILEPRIFSLKQVRAMILKRQIRDAKSLVPLFYYLTEKGAL